MKFIGIVGTNASFSYNRKLLWFMKRHFTESAEIEILEIADLPLFGENQEVPNRIEEIAQAIEESDGVIFATAEYNHAITAALKSFLEWLSSGDLQPFVNTPAMIVGASLGNLGTVYAQENLRQILSSPGLEAFVLPNNQFMMKQASAAFDEEGQIKDIQTIQWLEQCFENFKNYARFVKVLRTQDANKFETTSRILKNGLESVNDRSVEKEDGKSEKFSHASLSNQAKSEDYLSLAKELIDMTADATSGASQSS